MKITAHVLIIERDPEASGKITLIDNFDKTVWPIENGSFPQSYTSKGDQLDVEFNFQRPRNMICKIFPPCIRFLLEFTSDKGNIFIIH